MITSVSVIEDNPYFLQKLVNLITSTPELSLFGIAVDGRSGMELIARGPCDLYVVDLGVKLIDSDALIRQAIATHPGCNVMVVSAADDEAEILASIEAGSTGHVSKDAAPEDILDCMRNLRAGGAWLSPVVARKVLLRMREERSMAALSPKISSAQDGALLAATVYLTKREIELLPLLAHGLSFLEIGDSLAISRHTVVQHIKNIYRKLAVNSRGQAVYAASRMGLIS